MTPIQRLLDEGVPEEDLIEMVDRSAELVEAGKQQPRFWYPENLFAGTSMQRWIADIASHQAGVPVDDPVEPKVDLEAPDPEADELRAYMEYGKQLFSGPYKPLDEATLPEPPLARSQPRPRPRYEPFTADGVLVTKDDRAAGGGC